MRQSKKNKFAVDKDNRLVIKRPEGNLAVNGSFAVDKNNRLYYWLNEPLEFRKRCGLPGRIDFDGNFYLDSQHNLKFILKGSRIKEESLSLKSEIIAAEKDSMVFAVKSRLNNAVARTSLVKLNGRWQADKYNRLEFIVSKKPSPDKLALTGRWRVNDNQQIEYSYEKTVLKRKTKRLKKIIFEGYWLIENIGRIRYVISAQDNSFFEFRVQNESVSLYPKDGVIRYRLGAGIKNKKRTGQKEVSLFGTWKLGRKYQAEFVMDYGKRKQRAIKFDTKALLNKTDKVILELRNKADKPLGMNLCFTHAFLKRPEAESFLRLKSILERDKSVEAGVKSRW